MNTTIVGIGDSNWEFGGHGWAYGFSEKVTQKTLVFYPGGSSRDVLRRIKKMSITEKEVPKGSIVVINLGINDVLQGIHPYETAANHAKIRRVIKKRVGSRQFVWMPSHWTGDLEVEVARWWIYQTAKKYKDVKFINLFRWAGRTVWNNPHDPYHLSKGSYRILARKALNKIL